MSHIWKHATVLLEPPLYAILTIQLWRKLKGIPKWFKFNAVQKLHVVHNNILEFYQSFMRNHITYYHFQKMHFCFQWKSFFFILSSRCHKSESCWHLPLLETHHDASSEISVTCNEASWWWHEWPIQFFYYGVAEFILLCW